MRISISVLTLAVMFSWLAFSFADDLSPRQRKMVRGMVCLIKGISAEQCMQDSDISRITDILIRQIQSSPSTDSDTDTLSFLKSLNTRQDASLHPSHTLQKKLLNDW